MSTQPQVPSPQVPPLDIYGLIFNATSELIIIVLFALTVFIFWFMWTFIYPPVSKTYIKAKLGMGRGRAIFNVTGDERYTATYLGIPLPQGVVNISSKDKPRFILLPRSYLPEPPHLPSLKDEKGNDLPAEDVEKIKEQHQKDLADFKEKTLKDVPTYTDFSLRRTFRAGVNRPEYDVYSGKAVAVSPSTLAALGLPEEESNVWSNFNIFERIGRAELKVKKSAEILFGTLIDSRILKTTIQSLFTDAQLRKIHSDAYTAGQESVRGGTHNVLPIILIMVVLIMGIIALKIAGVF